MNQNSTISKNIATEELRRVHKYLVGDRIGRGTFSSIFNSVRNHDFSPVAIKAISKRRISQYPTKDDILFAERKLAPLLDHINIVKIHDTIENEGQIFQVMDIYNRNLLDFMDDFYGNNNGRRSNIIPLKIVDDILASVEYLHKLNLCHRDIKPENILLSDSPENSVKLCDFDFLSFALNPMKNSVCGSFGYTAPEVFADTPYDGRKADIWSIGILIYVLFGKKFPFNPKNTDSRKFDTTTIDYLCLPKEVISLVKFILINDPNKRPTITEIRNHKTFDVLSPNQRSISNINKDFTKKVELPNELIISRISETVDESLMNVAKMLEEENTINIYKILYFMIDQKLKQNRSQNKILAQNSSLSSSESYFRFSLPRIDIQIEKEFDYIVKEETFNENSFVLEHALSKIFLGKKYCVSTSIDGQKTVILNMAENDICIDAKIQNNYDRKTCKITMTGNATADKTIEYVAESLRLQFNCQK